ncbi:hypothetical protein BKA69DRAFT_1049985 [Paraphysoderma sedebokerense]|nr:hypothetical protein BKA69DRAFT_1049985 [Paraphysoderma sedebokerense]
MKPQLYLFLFLSSPIWLSVLSVLVFINILISPLLTLIVSTLIIYLSVHFLSSLTSTSVVLFFRKISSKLRDEIDIPEHEKREMYRGYSIQNEEGVPEQVRMELLEMSELEGTVQGFSRWLNTRKSF